MEYIYTLSEKGNLLSFDEYVGEQIQDNQTLVQYYDYFANPCFNFETQKWYDGEPLEELPTPKTEEELLQEQIEETKYKTVTEYELRKLLAEQQKNNMQMMMMMLRK